MFPREIRAISDSFHNNTPGLTLNYAVRIEPKSLYSKAEDEVVLKDKVEKKLNLELICPRLFREQTKTYKLKKFINVYNLISPVLNKFTFFHKSSIGNRYNKLITNLLGKPILNQSGNFKYPYNFPLVLINGPLNNDIEIPGDTFLLKEKMEVALKV